MTQQAYAPPEDFAVIEPLRRAAEVEPDGLMRDYLMARRAALLQEVRFIERRLGLQRS